MDTNERVLIENTTGVDHNCVLAGAMYTIFKFQQKLVPAPLANQFVTDNPGRVKIIHGTAFPEIAGEGVFWMANMTGNPFAPETVSVMQRSHVTGRRERIEVPNKIQNPIALTYKIRLGETWVLGVNDLKDRIPAPLRTVTLMPYRRVPLSETIADRLLQRAATYEADCQGSLVQCAPPGEFEPNDTWPLNDIRVYAQLLDKEGLSDKSVGISHEKSYDKNQTALDDAKHKLLQWMHFRLCDNNYRPPTREEYDLQLKKLSSQKS